MALNIAINGLGRLGRELIYQIVTSSNTADLTIVAVNDKNISNIEDALYFLNYNSTNLGRRTSCYFSSLETNPPKFTAHNYNVTDNTLNNRQPIYFYNQEGPDVNWANHGVNILIDCTGETNTDYLNALYSRLGTTGTRKVFFCGANSVFPVYVPGVSSELSNTKTIVGLGDANSQALASILHVLYDAFYGLTAVTGTIVQSYTNDQTLLDGPKLNTSLEKCRAAAENIVPVSFNHLALNLSKIEWSGIMNFKTLRVPVSIGSAVSLSAQLAGAAPTPEDVKSVLRSTPASNYINYYDKPYTSDGKYAVSSDIIGNTSAITILPHYISTTTTTDNKTVVHLVGLYDSESGFAYQIIKALKALKIN